MSVRGCIIMLSKQSRYKGLACQAAFKIRILVLCPLRVGPVIA